MSTLHLRSDSVSVLLSTGPAHAPQAEVLHWGPALADADADLSLLTPPISHSAFDVPVVAGLLPQASSGWLGRQALRGSRDGKDFSPALRLTEVEPTPDGRAARIVHADDVAGLAVTHRLHLHANGMLELSAELGNTGASPYQLDELGLVLPVPAGATELLDLSGRWCREQHPRRHRIEDGTWVRSGRHARTGHDSSLLIAVGTPGFANRRGRVWATHFGWSGDREQYLDALTDGRRMLAGAELLGSGEIVLEPGETYSTPVLYAAYSDAGVDGISAVFHEWFRERETHPARPRPVVLNTWEAVYFDHELEPLVALADRAAAVGVERFVLDDGWYRGRRDDHRALGDWFVDGERWPDGLGPLIDAVHARGMDFGLWVEPEMVSVDSDLARAHSDWISGPVDSVGAARLPLEFRHQHVLDLVNPEAWQYVYERMHALLEEYDIAYLKWDQNRDLTEAGHAGHPSVHAQTLALYRLIDALKAAHPTVEIESCASGGGRIDLGILARTDRVWPSDCNDALERQTIQRWTQAVLPPELVGTHIGPPRAHTTGRALDLSFRAITALFGHLGIEWDLREAGAAELETLARAVALYKEHRGLLHTGRRVNADLPDPNLLLHGVIAGDGSEGLFAAVALGSSVATMPGSVGLPGLDPQRRYRVEPIALDSSGPGESTDAGPRSSFMQIAAPAWMEEGAEASGSFLAEVGVALPILQPAHALLLHATAIDRPADA
ncbi:alpha-galactosidase [Microbacterium rhizosphaerae]|uniref:alpha-galactosidase n=1 Tax=Microbacterium rhizosphaerae TaxID=1678237 RepID=A0ABZ0SS27_9MICO|nr:alpha-galactosidase [Microbacterium rhizosphaerae]WPR90950.1 alpha-galactosidase [Microbacterium rhizosphaerae]